MTGARGPGLTKKSRSTPPTARTVFLLPGMRLHRASVILQCSSRHGTDSLLSVGVIEIIFRLTTLSRIGCFNGVGALIN